MSVWIDGRLVADHEAVVPYDDHGITVGDGAFETIRWRGGELFALDRHLDRLERSLAALLLDGPSRAEVEAACAAVAAEHGGDGFVRITVTGGQGPLGSPREDARSRLIVAMRPGEVRTDPTDVVVVPWTRNERGALAGVKSTSYADNVIALAYAQARGADEALFANTRDELCEGTGSNVFVVIDDRLVTPPLDSGCLAGINRALLLEVLDDVEEAPLPMSQLDRATEMFLTSTGRLVQPVRALDGVALASCVGPHTQRAIDAWTKAYGRN